MAFVITDLDNMVSAAFPELLQEVFGSATTLSDFNIIPGATNGSRVPLLDQSLNFTITSDPASLATDTATTTLSDNSVSMYQFHSRVELDPQSIRNTILGGQNAGDETVFFANSITNNISTQTPLAIETFAWSGETGVYNGLITEASASAGGQTTADAFSATDTAAMNIGRLETIIAANDNLLEGGILYTSAAQIRAYGSAVGVSAANGFTQAGIQNLGAGSFVDPVFGLTMKPIHGYTGTARILTPTNNLYMGVDTP